MTFITPPTSVRGHISSSLPCHRRCLAAALRGRLRGLISRSALVSCRLGLLDRSDPRPQPRPPVLPPLDVPVCARAVRGAAFVGANPRGLKLHGGSCLRLHAERDGQRLGQRVRLNALSSNCLGVTEPCRGAVRTDELVRQGMWDSTLLVVSARSPALTPQRLRGRRQLSSSMSSETLL